MKQPAPRFIRGYCRLPRQRSEWISLGLGVALLAYSLPMLYFGIVSGGWRTAVGTVTYSQALDSGRRMEVDVRYTYVVAGREYSGDRWRFRVLINRMRSQDVSATQAVYPVGSHPQVWVDPDDPTRSVLEPGPEWEDLLWVGGGLLFLAFGLLPSRAECDVQAPSAASGAQASAFPATPSRPRSTFARMLAIAGMMLLVFGAYRILDVMRGASWPTVEGTVLYSSMSDALSMGNRQTEIRYEYVLADQRHSGSASLRAGHDEALALARAHPVGSVVAVHYDPTHPERSTIQTHLNWHHAVLPAFAFVLFLLAAVAHSVSAASKRIAQSARRG